MTQYKSTSIHRREIIMDELFEEGVTHQHLLQIVKSKNWKQYKQIVDKEKVRSININALDREVKKLEKKGVVGEVFKATIKEMRRSGKARLASEKHKCKRETQTSFLVADITILMGIRAELLKERARLQREESFYRIAIKAL